MSKVVVAVLIAVMLLTSAAFGQQTQDVIHLKNGSVIRGTIIEQIPGVSVKIETADGNVFVYNMTEIAKITKETARPVGGTRIQGQKSPALAFVLSFFIVGLGQHYNGEYTKGIIQEVAAIGGAVMYLATWEDVLYYDPYWDEYYWENEPSTWSYIGLAIAGGAGIWSMIDAPVSAARINKELGYGHMLEFNKGSYVIGFDIGPKKQGIGADITLHF